MYGEYEEVILSFAPFPEQLITLPTGPAALLFIPYCSVYTEGRNQ